MVIYDLKNSNNTTCIKCNLSCAIGNFDGIHIGHQELLKATISRAKEIDNCASAILSFSNNTSGSPQIFSLENKLKIAKDYGIEYAIIYDFSEIRDLSPSEFVNDILVKKLNVKVAICGFNFRFGKFGCGNADSLQNLMNSNSLEAVIVAAKIYENEPISSSRIRQCLINGDIEKASIMLGRNYTISSPVIHGRKLGRTLGFPTINQPIDPRQIVPRIGVYLSKCIVDGKEYFGLSNVGYKPTIDESNLTPNIETNIFDFNEDIYTKIVDTSIIKFIRDEKKFSSINELKETVLGDIKIAKEFIVTNNL